MPASFLYEVTLLFGFLANIYIIVAISHVMRDLELSLCGLQQPMIMRVLNSRSVTNLPADRCQILPVKSFIWYLSLL